MKSKNKNGKKTGRKPIDSWVENIILAGMLCAMRRQGAVEGSELREALDRLSLALDQWSGIAM